MTYEYKMVQSTLAVLQDKKHPDAAARWLEQLSNEWSGRGWEFFRVDTMAVVKPAGCLGGSRPGTAGDGHDRDVSEAAGGRMTDSLTLLEAEITAAGHELKRTFEAPWPIRRRRMTPGWVVRADGQLVATAGSVGRAEAGLRGWCSASTMDAPVSSPGMAVPASSSAASPHQE